MKPLRWKQIGDDYELRCPCCASSIAIIYKTKNNFEGFLRIGPKVESMGGYGPPEATGKTFKAVRAAVNKRIEELLNHD